MINHILVDGMNLAYRIAHVPSFMDLRTKNGLPTGLIHGFLSSMLLFAGARDNISVVWDSYSKHKRDIYPDYKGNRNKDATAQAIREDVDYQLTPLNRILTLMGIDQYRVEGYEADEIIGTLVFLMKPPTIIMSEDKDFLQLVSDTIHIWQPIQKRRITPINFASLYMGLTPEQYFYYRLLTGDVSDNIPGVPGCGEKTALEMIYDKWNHKVPGPLTKKLLKKISASEIVNITARNENLMYLSVDSVPYDKLTAGTFKGYYDKERLLNSLNTLELRQVLDAWRGRR